MLMSPFQKSSVRIIREDRFYFQYKTLFFFVLLTDLLALPDTTTSDTENWGLTILRENRLILNEEITSVRQKQYLAETIADQLSHYCKLKFLSILLQ